MHGLHTKPLTWSVVCVAWVCVQVNSLVALTTDHLHTVETTTTRGTDPVYGDTFFLLVQVRGMQPQVSAHRRCAHSRKVTAAAQGSAMTPN